MSDNIFFSILFIKDIVYIQHLNSLKRITFVIMAAVDVLTPVLSSGRSRRLENVDKTPTTNDILSPATRRRAGLGGQVSYLPTSAMNDDAAEQQERMKSRLAQLHQKGLASPATQSER